MVLYTLDAVVRNYLVRKRYPIHYYIDGLVSAASCLRELTIDDLQIVNTKIIPIDTNGYADLPNDYVDYAEVGIKIGEKVRPLVESDKLNQVPAYTSDFQETKYSAQQQTTSNGDWLFYNYAFPLLWNTVTWNEYGENIGRLFGWGNGSNTDTFTIIKAQNRIKVDESLCVNNLVLRYISDGQSADAASQIPSEAYDTINKYIAWQMKENYRTYSEGEKQRAKNEYLLARGVLRARLSDVTIEKIKRVFQNNYYAAARQ